MKLSPKFYGPFEVLEKIEIATYKLLTPEGVRVHNIFHVSLLQ